MTMVLLQIIHRSRRSAGFTLIELIVVMAITSLLAVVAIIGQSELQQRARFDSAVDKTIQNIAYARNFSQSNVNAEGSGNDATTLLVGSELEFDDRHHFGGYSLEEMTPIYAPPDAGGYPDLSSLLEMPADVASNPSLCPAAGHPADDDECFEDFFNLPEPLIMLDPNKPGYNTNYATEFNSPNIDLGIMLFINTGHGLEICHETDPSGTGFGSSCLTSRTVPYDFVLVDESGLHATIEVDPNSGFAKRLN